ncbi:MAG: 4-(cytidine 5'-diphospho)-2-C-methyl-D-erythritol kinase [bacterium]
MPERLRLDAPAKINLGLRILRRREDGYHELETVLHTLAWGDEVHLERAGKITLEMVPAPDAPRPETVAEIPSDEQNLAWRAARALLDHAGLPGVGIRLVKRVPPGAGLGGGSSDAAAVLKGVDALYGTGLPRKELACLASGLGADVPFFLEGGCALAEGKGDRLTPLPAADDTPVLLLLPDFSVDTAWAYGRADWALTREAAYREYLPSDSGPVRVCIERGFENDLARGVVEVYPEVETLLGRLRGEGAVHVSMTGSGSAVYGLFDTVGRARTASRHLASRYLRTVLTELR